MHFRTNQELVAVIQARKSGLPAAAGLGSNSNADERQPASPVDDTLITPSASRKLDPAPHNNQWSQQQGVPFPSPSPSAASLDSALPPTGNQPTIAVILCNLSSQVSDFDLVSLIPPHMYPSGIRNNAAAGGWAQLVFERLDDGIAVWNHTRHLLVGGHLDHLRDGGRAEGLKVKLAPQPEYLMYMFEATKSFMTNPPKLPPPNTLHISNLFRSVHESDISSLFPPDLSRAICTINAHSPGKSLSPPFPDTDPLHPLPRVGRATVYFESMDAAVAAFEHLGQMRGEHRSELNMLMFSKALMPLVLCPGIVRVVLEARARMGDDERVRRMLESAVATPIVAAPAPAPAPAPPLPTPSPTIASSRSSASSSSPPPPPLAKDSPHGNDNNPRPSFAKTTFISTPTAAPIHPPSDPYSQIHLVIVRNLSPTLSPTLIHALATPTGDFSAPTHIDISPTTKSTVLAYHTIEVRPVKYVFRTRDDVKGFLNHIRDMDKRGELHEYKADRGLRMCAFPLRVPGGGVGVRRSAAEAGADWW